MRLSEVRLQLTINLRIFTKDISSQGQLSTPERSEDQVEKVL